MRPGERASEMPVAKPPQTDERHTLQMVSAGGAKHRSPVTDEAKSPTVPRFLAVKRVSMAAATVFLAVNLWTGAPLIAIWIGSQTVGTTTLSMQAVCVVLLVLAVLLFVMAAALAWLTSTYHALTGHPSGEQRLRWLRSMNTQKDPVSGVPISVPERIVMVSVCIAVITLLIWFFFFAGSPLPHP